MIAREWDRWHDRRRPARLADLDGIKPLDRSRGVPVDKHESIGRSLDLADLAAPR